LNVNTIEVPQNQIKNEMLHDRLKKRGKIEHLKDFYFVSADQLWKLVEGSFGCSLLVKHVKVKKDVSTS
jgi:hypothetical protein